MTFEEMERTMQFILEQQAQIAVSQAKAEEKAKERMAESDERISRIEAIQENTAQQIKHLSGALIELTEAHTRTQETLRELAEAQRHGDRRLDALIDIVGGGKDAGQ